MEKVKKTQQEASRTLQEMHFSNTNSFPTGWRSAGGHQLLLLLVRAVRLAPADLSSRPPLQPLSARPQPPAPPAAREGGGRVHFELISAVKGSNNKINALGSSGPAERRGTRANGAGSSRGGGLENSTRSAFETQLPDPFCRCSGAGSSEPMGGSPGYCAAGGASQRDAPNLLPGSSIAHACLGLLWAPRAPGLPPSTAALGHPNLQHPRSAIDEGFEGLRRPAAPLPHWIPPYLTGHGAIPDDGALAPGKRVLEGLEEVKDAPTDDDVVIETDKKADLCWGGGGHSVKQ